MHVTALVTGANRGLGRCLAAELLARGARVFAAARRVDTVDLPGVIPIQLDITDPESVRRAADHAGDVNLLVNNAGISTRAALLSGSLEQIRAEMETHYFGTLNATRAFVPVIEDNGGGWILNVLSVLAWHHPASTGAYSAAKAAEWALTNSLREELFPKGIHVAGLHVGLMDTDMGAVVDTDDKADPALVAAAALDGVFANEPEILADAVTRAVKAQLSAIP